MRDMIVWVLAAALQEPSHSVRDQTGIAAKINGEIVTWDEIELRLRGYKPEERTEELRRAELRNVTEDRLYQQFARKHSITVTELEVDEALKRARKNAGGDLRFEQYLTFLGRTLSQYRAELAVTLMKYALYRKLANDAVRNPSLRSLLLWEPVSPDELRDYYKTHSEEFRGLNHVTVWRIALKYAAIPADDRDLKMRLAESLLRKIGEGSDFLVLAHYYSDVILTDKSGKKTAGYRELRREDSPFTPETTARIFEKMDDGDVSPVIDEGAALNIFKMEMKVNRKPETFDEAQLKIRSRLENQKREENRLLLRGELLKQSYVEPADLFR